ncbi:fimbrial protein [Salmonella enterica]|nr:fimbrial protein [Salmonella enterica]
MNVKLSAAFLLTLGLLALPVSVNAGVAINTNDSQQVSYDYDFSRLTIPQNAGQMSWFDDQDHVYWIENVMLDGYQGHITMTVNGTQVSTAPDGSTVYATNNPGIGIAYALNYSTEAYTPPTVDTTAPYEIVFNDVENFSGYVHVKYTLVRLADFVPSGKITSVPEVTLNYFNQPDTPNYPRISFLARRNSVSGQPKITSCTIDAPTEIKLPDLYGNALANGAQGITDAPTITLSNCPGAINTISYNFSAYYGTHNAANGVLKTMIGSGYAKNVYIQVQNDDGTAHQLNTNIALDDYKGSGNYPLPKFKVAYYIDDASTVAAGKVSSAIEIKLTYN